MTGHDYLSTACLHEVHQHCRSAVNEDGQPKVPGTCKFCSARCRCTCHQDLPVLARETFPAQVADAREALGWSQEWLATLVGVGQQAISNWENGRSIPQGDNLQRLSSALGFMPCHKLPGPVASATSTGATSTLTLDSLPLLSMGPDQFVALTTDLLTMVFPGALISEEVSPDIDLHLLTAAGERLAVHCSRARKFQPTTLAQVHTRLEQQGPSFDRALVLLRCKAGLKVRQKAAEWAPRWEIWDTSVIAGHLHSVGRERALPLVEEYFPGLGGPFFGIATEH